MKRLTPPPHLLDSREKADLRCSAPDCASAARLIKLTLHENWNCVEIHRLPHSPCCLELQQYWCRFAGGSFLQYSCSFPSLRRTKIQPCVWPPVALMMLKPQMRSSLAGLYKSVSFNAVNNFAAVSCPLGLIWLLVKPRYIGVRMACINYTGYTARSIVAPLTTSNCRTRQKSGCRQQQREQADSVTSRVNQHPGCICFLGVSWSVQHMFKISETGNEARWINVLGKLGCGANIVILACRREHCSAPSYNLFLFVHFMLKKYVALEAKCF